MEASTKLLITIWESGSKDTNHSFRSKRAGQTRQFFVLFLNINILSLTPSFSRAVNDASCPSPVSEKTRSNSSRSTTSPSPFIIKAGRLSPCLVLWLGLPSQFHSASRKVAGNVIEEWSSGCCWKRCSPRLYWVLADLPHCNVHSRSRSFRRPC